MAIKIALLGLGTVGSGVLKIIKNNQKKIKQTSGEEIVIKKALVRNLKKHQNVAKEVELTTNYDDILHDAEIKIVVELMGGLHPAKEYISGKHAKRIKFQTNTGGNIGGQPTCPMMLNGEIPSKTLKRNKIDIWFISAVRNFVLNNQFVLEKAADELIRDSEFRQIMIKSGKIASTEEKMNWFIRQR